MQPQLTFVTGPDAFLSRTAVYQIRAEVDPDGFNTTDIDARTAASKQSSQRLLLPAFFGSIRLIIVRDLLTVAARKASSDDEDGDQAKPSTHKTVDWPALFGRIQPGNVAVFVDRELSGVPAAVKRALPSDATVILGDPPRGRDLVSWMTAQALSRGSTLAEMDARYLAELLCPTTWNAKPSNPAYDRPPDLDLFVNEIDKLSLAAYPDAITRSLMAEMSLVNQPDRLFPLIDAVIAGEGARAIDELKIAMTRGDDLPRITVQLNQQIELMAVLEQAGRTDPLEIGRAIGLSNPARMINVGKAMRSLRSSPSDLVSEAVDTERKFKTGVLRQPADQLYGLVERVLSSGRQTRQGST